PTALLRSALEVLGAPARGAPPPVAVYSHSSQGVPSGLPWRRMPDDAPSAAHDLFAALRSLDDSGAPLIWVESPPDTPEWEGVHDRLQRAAA
ncbi:MAG: translation factor Sua5, partial [Burkholderiales bacterium]|nr:translation factor Sua5 [Burkholderiales bacterium]